MGFSSPFTWKSQYGRSGNFQGETIMCQATENQELNRASLRGMQKRSAKILFAGTIIFSGCSGIKLNLGEELNVTSLPPPVLLNILQRLLNILQSFS